MKLLTTTLLTLGLSVLTKAHFVLQVPTSFGFDDDNEGNFPCGGFDVATRTNVTKWPIKGGDIGILTTHPSVTWEYKAGVVCDGNVTEWKSLTPILNQTGVGYFCEPQIPGIKAWIGKPVVLQVIQHGPDGDLYQCAAIKYVAGGPATLSPDCTNTTGVAAVWQKPKH